MNDLEFPEIETGNGMDRDLAATTNDRIKKAVIAIDNFAKTIKGFNEQSSRQTEKMIWLTRWIVVLTIFMIIGLVIQIILAIPTKTSCTEVANSDGSKYTYTCITNIGLGLLGNRSFQREIISDLPMRFP